MGSPNDLAAALNIIQSDGPAQGLLLNRSKSLIYSPLNEANSPVNLPPDIPSTSEGFVLLGSPIGPPSFCEEVLHSCIEKLKDAVNHLSDLENSYLQTASLRSCLSLPKLSFILWTCPPSHISNATRAFDNIIRKCLEVIIGGPISTWSWLKATLPSKWGGLNLCNASLHSAAAFLSSYTSSLQLVEEIISHPPAPSPHLPSVVLSFSQSTIHPDWTDLENMGIGLY